MDNTLASVTLDELTIEDEDSFAHVALYEDLREILRRVRYPFRVLAGAHEGRWDRALFLNLTYWSPSEGSDILADASIAADVVAHVAWHHLATKAVGSSSADAMFLGESIASAFDLYLVGRVLARPRPRAGSPSSFLETQVPAMAEATRAAGLSARKFEALLGEIAAEPERAFEDLRALLFNATRALYECKTPSDAQAVFARLEGHRFGALLHHYELSNWVLFARAHATSVEDERVREIDRALSSAEVSLDWLVASWVAPALA